MLTLTATVDHRFVDGYQLGTLAKVIRSVLTDPWQLEGGKSNATAAELAKPAAA